MLKLSLVVGWHPLFETQCISAMVNKNKHAI